MMVVVLVLFLRFITTMDDVTFLQYSAPATVYIETSVLRMAFHWILDDCFGNTKMMVKVPVILFLRFITTWMMYILHILIFSSFPATVQLLYWDCVLPGQNVEFRSLLEVTCDNFKFRILVVIL